MSQRSTPLSADEDVVNLTIELRGLTITVSGTSSRASSLVHDLVHLDHTRDPVSHGSPSAVPPSSTQETRDSIERSFCECPTPLLALSTRLSAVGTYTASDRIKRAWRAGQWAGATIEKRVSSPNRTPTIGLPNRVYVVLRSSNRSSPAIFNSSRAFFQEVGDLATSEAVCHGFASEGEARAYCAGAGEDFPESQ